MEFLAPSGDSTFYIQLQKEILIIQKNLYVLDWVCKKLAYFVNFNLPSHKINQKSYCRNLKKM